eukprot:TRINITY_DN58718_c0_g1_i1.p1 TRINITY_DN58718_c0_g1~~TRINITY_DN58718_c0_g1_i1.p1  ORF type:complete len:266 (+),score=58.14 TRINITY_DN58718_c0_g1_i1:82-879(+)
MLLDMAHRSMRCYAGSHVAGLVRGQLRRRGFTTASNAAKAAQTSDRVDRAFAQIKRDFLSKPDKSGAGGIDAGVAPLCAAINDLAGVFTTSSCAGRALLWMGDEPPGKKSGTPRLTRPWVSHDIPEDAAFMNIAFGFVGKEDATLWLRYEPLILHVCCKDWITARRMLAACRAAGLKRLAVFGNGPQVSRREDGDATWRLEIEGNDRLDMPLVVGGARAFNASGEAGLDDWLLKTVQRKFERNSERIERLKDLMVLARSEEGVAT